MKKVHKHPILQDTDVSGDIREYAKWVAKMNQKLYQQKGQSIIKISNERLLAIISEHSSQREHNRNRLNTRLNCLTIREYFKQ